MSRWLYVQVEGGEERWSEILEDQRASVIAEKRPRFITVLSLDALIPDAPTREDIAQAKYLGPFYVDFDGESLEAVLPKFRQFLSKLEELDVDLSMLQLFATGGRGFHILAPLAMFAQKWPRQGIQYLPAIFKEIAFELFVDTLDLRVYTARKGRMFRVENSLRENGLYKVPITLEQALGMSVDDYKEICSAPRAAPAITPPAYCPKLAVLYVKAEQKVAAAAKKRKDGTKDMALLARFGGGFPPSLLKVMAGEGSRDGLGFHPIAMQIAITANALDKKEEDVLALCEGLIQNHVSDGSRYNTPPKRRAELSRMLRYTSDNPCYTYSKDAVRKLVPQGAASTDLDGMPASAGEVMGGEPEEGQGMRGGVFMTKAGMYRKTDEGVQQISDVAFVDPVILTDALSGNRLGYEAELIIANRSIGRKVVEQQTFLSRQFFQKFAMQHMGAFKGTDNDLASASTILRDTAMASGGNIYLINREGLDVIPRPDTGAGESFLDLMWVSPEEVTTESPLLYKFKGDPTPGGIFKSDLLDAPRLSKGDEAAAEVIHALLNVNVPFVIGNVLGWMVSAFHRQVYHKCFGEFPLLSLFGQAGCGKTNTMRDFIQMHYFRQEPVVRNAAGDTKHALESSLRSSASIPLVLDEYKPTEMATGRHGMLRGMLRSAYNATTFAKGGMATEPGSTWRDIRSSAYSAPVLYIGETLETETAMLHRTVAVPLRAAYIEGRRDHHRLLQARRPVVSSLGHEIVRCTFKLNFDDFVVQVRGNEAVAREIAGARAQERPVFNLAVVMTGLDFVKQVFGLYYGTQFDQQIAVLKDAVNDVQMQVSTSAMPEASKALNQLSLMTHTEDLGSEFGMKIGVDYYVDGDNLDLAVRNCYVKLAGWCRRKGQTPYFSNEEAFMHGLANYGPLRSKSTPTSPLKLLPGRDLAKVFRFSVKALIEEGVDRFRDDSPPDRKPGQRNDGGI